MKAKEFLKKFDLEEMAFNRQKWQESCRNTLRGALTEFTKLTLARKFNYKDNWSNEIKRLVNKSMEHMDKDIVTTSTNFNRLTALKEVFKEVRLAQDRVTKGKGEFERYYPDMWQKIARFNLTSDDLLDALIKEFVPKYANLL